MPIDHFCNPSKTTSSSPATTPAIKKMAQAMIDRMSSEERHQLSTAQGKPEAAPSVCLVCDHFGLLPTGHRPGDKTCPKYAKKEGGWRRVDYRQRLGLADDNAARRAKAALIRRLNTEGKLPAKTGGRKRTARTAKLSSSSSSSSSPSPERDARTATTSTASAADESIAPPTSPRNSLSPIPPPVLPMDPRVPPLIRLKLPTHFPRPPWAQFHFALQSAAEQRTTIAVEMSRPNASASTTITLPTADSKVITAKIEATISKTRIRVEPTRMHRAPAKGTGSTDQRLQDAAFLQRLRKSASDAESRRANDEQRIFQRKAALEALLEMPGRDPPNDFSNLLDPDSIHYLGERLTAQKYAELVDDKPKAVEKWRTELLHRLWHLDPAFGRPTREEFAAKYPTTAELIDEVSRSVPALGNSRKQQITADSDLLLQRKEPTGKARPWTAEQLKKFVDSAKFVRLLPLSSDEGTSTDLRTNSQLDILYIDDSTPASPSPSPIRGSPTAKVIPAIADQGQQQQQQQNQSTNTHSSTAAQTAVEDSYPPFIAFRPNVGASSIGVETLPRLSDPLHLSTDPIRIGRDPDLRVTLSPTAETLLHAYHTSWAHLKRLEALLMLCPTYTAAAMRIPDSDIARLEADDNSTDGETSTAHEEPMDGQ
ncbi:hypothetical protein niasHS_004823 [Heterodera schachtii]|uniref:Uncharacterized protein n=1 Tax=Heterodera schachtii TaxID=97005 RepID=A0ABD2JU99_HETSC